MKFSIGYKGLFLILILATFNSCNKEPEATGITPMYATINGSLHKFDSPRGYYNTEELSINVQSNQRIYSLSINSPEVEILDIPENAVVGDVFPIVEFGTPDLYFISRDGVGYFASSGTLKVISHDPSAKTMEVTFSCTLKEVFDETRSVSLTGGSATFNYTSLFPQ